MATLVFVHGWSITNTATYGDLPWRLQQQASAAGMRLTLTDLWLSEYVSFDDAVGMDDLVRAFDHALRGLRLDDGPFACITHSTGGPLVRSWLRAQRERPNLYSPCKLSHLIMLAPANYGSALARLGKGTLGRLKAWWGGVEPGQRVLDWLTHGSAEALALNLDGIHGSDPAKSGQYLFVLTGDRPDRKLYDQLNSYTGEDGSDGVVRIAAANLNACHAVLAATSARSSGNAPDTLNLQLTRAPRSAFKLIADAAHSGDAFGIMAGVTSATVDSILRCLQVADLADYAALCDDFAAENALRDADRVELEPAGPFAPRVHIHDPRSLLIVRIGDESGVPLPSCGALLTAGPTADPDLMPEGFMLDRQSHPAHREVISLFLNYSLLAGHGRVPDPRNRRKTLRAAVPAHRPYGARLQPYNLTGLVHHALAHSAAEEDLLDMLAPHQTTVLDVVLPRKLHEGLFRFTQTLTPEDFSMPTMGAVIP